LWDVTICSTFGEERERERERERGHNGKLYILTIAELGRMIFTVS
jgi:hypothetical protein